MYIYVCVLYCQVNIRIVIKNVSGICFIVHALAKQQQHLVLKLQQQIVKSGRQ